MSLCKIDWSYANRAKIDWSYAKRDDALHENKHGHWLNFSRIESKWIYKIKYQTNCEIEIYKARLIVKEFTQKEWFDFYETFVLVT